MTLVYLHGANATSDSFNYLRHHIKNNDEVVINYDSRCGFENNLEKIYQQLVNYDDLFFIGHSLGGIYSLHLSHRLPEQTIGAVTLSTPYNGAESAEYIRHFLPNHRLFRDIGPNSWPIKTSKSIEIQHPWTNVVSVAGSNPLIIYPNDGVVTISSMRYRDDMELIDLPVNHYEVVLSPLTLNIIRQRLSMFN